ncbi:TIGR00297 family protein [Cylindrospermopsis raciborskii C04]|uniref:TIGR00297 family protein n=1 Tax=Cylindrospermopsis raciborskii C07 TaxID=2014886 RepID=A0ABX4WP82_9CYAN|nr:TIGR00297 family protein [Cylindrospermopsis raciborskii]PNJ98026.1 TIGR00297 family protein [Cylindrospermopsis raciborskii C03]PNJ98866.1 TIGR00297 family protein [Cylindrospermopsis raciborskii C04]PNJ99927.1 TIGR00297 family protein [Cylindrospermopsis raciborskii C07]
MLELFNTINPWLVGGALNAALLTLVDRIPNKLLTPAGIRHAWLLGVIIWGTLGWPGYLVVGFYFIVGSGVTRIGIKQKQVQGIAEKRSGARGPENVWGSALIGALCSLGVLLLPAWSYVLCLGYVASFSTKLSDTTASEIGKAYGKRTFLITTLQPVSRGTEGAISLEGTLAGMVGSILVAIVGWSVNLIDMPGIFWCAIASFIATNLESVIGATLQSKYTWLTNEVVNIFNTLIGAIVAMILAVVFQRVLI